MHRRSIGSRDFQSTLAVALAGVGLLCVALACSSQGSPPAPPSPATGCLAQAAPAEHYRKQLEGFLRRTSPEARVTWSQDSTLCRHALAAVAAGEPPASGSPYVYEVSGAGHDRYIILWPARRSGELALACRYDEAWLRAGDCLGV